MLKVSEIPRKLKGNGRQGIVQFFAVRVTLHHVSPVIEVPVSGSGMRSAELLSSPVSFC